MTEELERAAATASEALGMNVATYDEPCGYVRVEIDNPVERPEAIGDGLTALAYLEGLETGARIQRERHRPLVAAAQAVSRLSFYGGDCDEYHVDADALRALTLALSQLED